MAKTPDSSRRDFLTGRAIGKEVRRLGDEVADALQEGETQAVAPQSGETLRLETKAMGCPWCVILNPGPSRQVMVASDAFDHVHEIEHVLTIYRDDSEVSQLNRDAFDEPQPVSEKLFTFLELNRKIYAATGGAFDPAAGALIQLWSQARRAGRVPDDDEIAVALKQSGLDQVEVTVDGDDRRIRYLADGLLLDFASIGKGYGIDLAVEHLVHEEIESFLIHGGHSSLYGHGGHHGIDGWPVGIKNPLFTDQSYATIVLKNAGMSTSGSNIQYFRYEGKRYGHLLDPRTGHPAEALLSVTVIAPTSAEADALSTAFYAMGLDNALEYCDDHQEIGAVLVPKPERGRLLEPIVKNIPSDRLFFDDDVSVTFG